MSNLSLYNYQQQGLYSFELSKFHDFPGLFEFPKTLGLAVTLKNWKTFLVLGYFWTLNSSTNTNSGVPQNVLYLGCLKTPFYAFSSAVTNLSNKILIFHDFQGPTIKFHDFPGLENEMLKFHDFPGFPWPVQVLKSYLTSNF